MLLLVGGRSATPAVMGALQFIDDVDRVKFLLCKHQDDLYLTFQETILWLLKASKPDLLCDNVRDVKTVDANDFDEVTTAVTKLCSNTTSLNYVNLTSAPQPMSFAVYNYLRTHHPQALPFSVNTHTSQIIPLIPGKKRYNLTKKLDVEAYIKACNTAVFQYKFKIDNLSCKPEQAEMIVHEFVANISQTNKFLTIIRKAGEVIKAPKKIPIPTSTLRKKDIRVEEMREFLQRLQEINLVTQVKETESGLSYRIETKHDHAFLYGDWLEYYVYLQAKKADFDSVKMSVELQGYNGEIDIFAVHNANALICECKTGKYRTDDLARLESKASKLGGNYCVRLFITTALEVTPEFCNQAKNRRIIVVNGNELPEISRILTKEMNQPAFQRN